MELFVILVYVAIFFIGLFSQSLFEYGILRCNFQYNIWLLIFSGTGILSRVLLKLILYYSLNLNCLALVVYWLMVVLLCFIACWGVTGLVYFSQLLADHQHCGNVFESSVLGFSILVSLVYSVILAKQLTKTYRLLVWYI